MRFSKRPKLSLAMPTTFPATRFRDQNDMCLGFFKTMYEAYQPPLPPGARLLELGCAEANWLAGMRSHRPDLYLVGIDTRHEHRPDADEHIIADLLQHDFPEASFDAIIAVSVTAWCGMGKYAGNPTDPEGDRKMLQRVHRWLKPDGWVYLDMPADLDAEDPRGFTMRRCGARAYTEAGLRDRLYQGLWTETARQRFNPGYEDGPYVALLLKKAA